MNIKLLVEELFLPSVCYCGLQSIGDKNILKQIHIFAFLNSEKTLCLYIFILWDCWVATEIPTLILSIVDFREVVPIKMVTVPHSPSMERTTRHLDAMVLKEKPNSFTVPVHDKTGRMFSLRFVYFKLRDSFLSKISIYICCLVK